MVLAWMPVAPGSKRRTKVQKNGRRVLVGHRDSRFYERIANQWSDIGGKGCVSFRPGGKIVRRKKGKGENLVSNLGPRGAQRTVDTAKRPLKVSRVAFN